MSRTLAALALTTALVAGTTLPALAEGMKTSKPAAADPHAQCEHAGHVEVGGRVFPYSYPYGTPGGMEPEVELYTDYDNGKFKNQLEVAMGLTDHTMLAIYGVLSQFSKFDAVKLLARHRLGDPDSMPVDTALQLEYEQFLDPAKAGLVEGRIVLEKRLGQLLVGSNLIGEKTLDSHPFELGATLGLGYEVMDHVTPGVELRYSSGTGYAGPTLAAGMGPLHLVGGVYAAFTGGYMARLILGAEF